MTKISCLICVHSQDLWHDALFHDAMTSVALQTFPVDQMVIVLDECWDNTRRIADRALGEFDNVNILVRRKKQGLAAAKNFGLERCTGDFVTYCDADDTWMACKLETQIVHQKSSGAQFTFTGAWDNYKGIWKPNCFKVGQYDTHDKIAAALPRENVLCHGSAMIYLPALRSLGGYPLGKQHLGREDWSLWQKALAAGFRFATVPERLYVYGMGTSVAR